MHQLTTFEAEFSAQLALDGSRPFVTYYDEATGERSELSLRSLANWVAKTHFLLVDELGLGVETHATITLPPHWISVAPILGCCSAGLALDAFDTDASVGFTTAETPLDALDVYAIAPSSAAVGFAGGPPPGMLDYVAAVRPQADAWSAVRFTAREDDELFLGRDRQSCVAWARERAGELGLTDGARVLSTRDWAGPEDWIDTLFAPLVVGGSVVYVRHADDATVERRATQERATVVLR